MSKQSKDILSEKDIIVSIRITGDKEIKDLNSQYLKRDYPTDVLSFSMNEKLDDGTYYLGDIVINKEQALRQSKNYGNDLEHEIADLCSHGILHLLGIHHHDDDENTVHGIRVTKEDK